MNTEKRNSEGGFALVELVAAAGILVIVMAGLTAAVVASMRSNAFVRERDIARDAARSQIEQVMAWDDLDTLVDEFDGSEFDAGNLDGTRSSQSPGTIEIDDTDPNLLAVTVSLNWTGIMGDSAFVIRTDLARTN